MNVDYNPLQKLLADGKWREADLETANKMCEVRNYHENKTECKRALDAILTEIFWESEH